MVSLPPPRTTELWYDGQWNPVSLRESTTVRINRGSGSEGGSARYGPTTATMTIGNRSGNYSPQDWSSPLYGKIGRNTPIRFMVEAGSPWLRLPGGINVINDRISTPDHPQLAITGDIDLRMDAAAVSWRAAPPPGYFAFGQMLALRFSSTTGRSWSWTIDPTGVLGLVWTPTGMFADRRFMRSTVPVPAHAGRRIALRVTLDVDNGAGGCTGRFYYGHSGVNGPWTPLGDPVTQAGTTTLHAGSAPLEVASGTTYNLLPDTNSAARFTGSLYRLQVRNGIDGPVAADLDLTLHQAGDTTLTDLSGLVWTLQGNTTVTNRHVRLEGEVPSWPQERDLSGNDAWVPIAPAGIMRRLDAGKKPIPSAIRYLIGAQATPPLACWPMTDGETATGAAPLTAGPAPLLPAITDGTATMGWADGKIGAWNDPTVRLPADTTGSIGAPVPSPAGVADEWHVDLCRSGPAGGEVLTATDIGAGTDANPRNAFSLVFQSGGDSVQLFRTTVADTGSSTSLLATITGAGIYTDAPHHIRLTANLILGAGATQWKLYLDGVERGENTIPIAYKGLASVRLSWEGLSGQAPSVGYLTCWGLSPPTAAAVYKALCGYPGEAAGTRILRTAAEKGVPATMSGLPEDQVPLGPQHQERFLDALTTAATADLGLLMEQRDGRALVYRGHDTLYTQPPTLVLDAATGVISAPFRPADDDKFTQNDITVTRKGGSSGRAVQETGTLSVQDPPDGVGLYDVEHTFNLFDDVQPEQHAAWMLHLGTYAGVRYTRLTLDLGNSRVYALIDDILLADVGDVIRILNPPRGHGIGPIDLLIRGYEEEIGAESWRITFTCAPAAPWTVGVLEDPVLGRLDTEGSELVSGISATATSWSVATTAGPVWVTAPAPLTPDVETGLSGWTGQGAAISRVPVPVPAPAAGKWALRVVPDGIATFPSASSSRVAVTAGQQYTVSGWLRCATSRTVALNVNWFTGSSTYLSTSNNNRSVAAHQWTWVELTVTAPATAALASIHPAVVGGTPPPADVAWVAHPALRPAQAGAMPDEVPFDVICGDERVTVTAITGAASPQTFTVVRAVNGVVQAHAAAADVRLADPLILAL
ncbi:hypothetical protein ACWEFL_15710 [Streptomyces sp. NPDC004838]